MTYQSPTAAVERLLRDGFFRDGKTDVDLIKGEAVPSTEGTG